VDELTRAVGKPRTVLDVGGQGGEVARSKGADVVDIGRDSPPAGLGDRRFDLIMCAGGDVTRFVPFLEDGGHVILSGTATDVVDGAGLELLWTSRTLVVARKRPLRRKLSLTVGMISMNEEGAVGAVIDDIRKHAPEAEVLLVDSSKDRTPEIAEARGGRVIRQFPPKGYGPAMTRLLYEARTDVIVTLDCDGTYPADRIMELHHLVEEGADLVNATRTRKHPKAMPMPNYFANRLFAAAAHVVHGLPTTDVHSGMRAYRTSMLRGIDVPAQGAALPVELMVVPARRGYHIVEVEIPYFERVGQTSLQRWNSTVWTFKRLLRARDGARARRDRVTIQ
jgi:hypothetical protein